MINSWIEYFFRGRVVLSDRVCANLLPFERPGRPLWKNYDVIQQIPSAAIIEEEREV